jgi:pilus assembly protein Flp/PilA
VSWRALLWHAARIHQVASAKRVSNKARRVEISHAVLSHENRFEFLHLSEAAGRKKQMSNAHINLNAILTELDHKSAEPQTTPDLYLRPNTKTQKENHMYSVILALSNFKSNLTRREEGVTALEYGLIAALIAVVIIGSVRLLGTNIAATFAAVAAAI